jgi:hypothetical protein
MSLHQKKTATNTFPESSAAIAKASSALVLLGAPGPPIPLAQATEPDALYFTTKASFAPKTGKVVVSPNVS